MLTDEDIFQRYLVKQAEFTKQTEISLIGHSLFDMWGEPQIAEYSIANLGISGTSTRQYLDVIVKPHLISQLGPHIFIFLGVNDIVKEPNYSPSQVLKWLINIYQHLSLIAPTSKYYLLEATPINALCQTVTNAQIQDLNQYLQVNCPAEIHFIKTYSSFADAEGNLIKEFSVDGLHFSSKGYLQLQQLLQKALL